MSLLKLGRVHIPVFRVYMTCLNMASVTTVTLKNTLPLLLSKISAIPVLMRYLDFCNTLN